jgi:hypothetical protein
MNVLGGGDRVWNIPDILVRAEPWESHGTFFGLSREDWGRAMGLPWLFLGFSTAHWGRAMGVPWLFLGRYSMRRLPFKDIKKVFIGDPSSMGGMFKGPH